MTHHAKAVGSAILASLLITAASAAEHSRVRTMYENSASEHSRVRSMFENAVKGTGKHGQIPVLVPTVLPTELAADAYSVVEGSEFMGVGCNSGGVGCESIKRCSRAAPCIDGKHDSIGYALHVFTDRTSGVDGFVGTIVGFRLDPAAPAPTNSGSVQLANGAIAYYNRQKPSIWWRTATVEYIIHLKLDTGLGWKRKQAALLKMANSMVVSSKQ